MRTLESAHVLVVAPQHVGRRREQLELLRAQGAAWSARDRDSKASAQARCAKASRPRETSSAPCMRLNLRGVYRHLTRPGMVDSCGLNG